MNLLMLEWQGWGREQCVCPGDALMNGAGMDHRLGCKTCFEMHGTAIQELTGKTG